MPQRWLKPGIVTSLRLARCSPMAQLLYYKLLSLVDDYSRYDAHPMVVSRAAFPYGDAKGRMLREAQIESLLGELENARLEQADDPCLIRYRVGGVAYLFLTRWEERVRSRSRYPSPAEDPTCAQMFADAVRCQQMLSNAVRCGQMSAPSAPSSSSPSAPSVPKNGGMDLKAQWKANDARRTTLEAIPEDERTATEAAELKKTRARLDEIQKKQAAGDFTPLIPATT